MLLTAPSITPKSTVNKRLLERIAYLTFPQAKSHPDIADFPLSDQDFVSPVIRVVDKEGVGYTTFWNERYFNMKLAFPTKGVSLIARVPEVESIGTTKDIAATVTNVQPPLAYQWLEALIRAGQVPAILEETALTFDFQCSLHSALSLKGVIWQWPSVKPLTVVQQVDGLETAVALMDTPIQFTDKISPIESEHEAVCLALKEIELQIRKSAAQCSGDMLVGLLPGLTLVTTTCTKTVVGWRSWLMSVSDTYEVAWLKVQLWKYLIDALEPLFKDCGKVEQNLRVFKQLHRTNS